MCRQPVCWTDKKKIESKPLAQYLSINISIYKIDSRVMSEVVSNTQYTCITWVFTTAGCTLIYVNLQLNNKILVEVLTDGKIGQHMEIHINIFKYAHKN